MGQSSTKHQLTLSELRELLSVTYCEFIDPPILPY